MNIEALDLKIGSLKLDINLKLYSILKEVVKLKLTSKQSSSILSNLVLVISNENSIDEKISYLTKELDKIRVGTKKKNELAALFRERLTNEEDFTILRLAIDLNRFKEVVLIKSTMIANTYAVSETVHIMSYVYDYNSLNRPYSVRVAGALLLNVLFENIHRMDDVLFEPIKESLRKVPQIEADTIIQIIYAESASQSLRSLAGATYESRFRKYIDSKGIKYIGQSHDKNVKAVEYDFILTSDSGKKIGVSVKRTLRERYKQNHEEIEALSVDAMFLITLGIDLNKAKVSHITAKAGYYILVADDIFERKAFLTREKKVYPITDLSNVFISSIFNV